MGTTQFQKMEEKTALEKTRKKKAAKSNVLHLVKKRARTGKRNAKPATKANLMETSLARINGEQKDAKKKRKTVRSTPMSKKLYQDVQKMQEISNFDGFSTVRLLGGL